MAEWSGSNGPVGCGSKMGTQNRTLVDGAKVKPAVQWFNFDPYPVLAVAQKGVPKWRLGKWKGLKAADCPGSLMLSQTRFANFPR